MYYRKMKDKDKREECKFIKYVDTLPNGTAFKDFPMLWEESEIKLLTGSPFLGYVHE